MGQYGWCRNEPHPPSSVAQPCPIHRAHTVPPPSSLAQHRPHPPRPHCPPFFSRPTVAASATPTSSRPSSLAPHRPHPPRPHWPPLSPLAPHQPHPPRTRAPLTRAPRAPLKRPAPALKCAFCVRGRSARQGNPPPSLCSVAARCPAKVGGIPTVRWGKGGWGGVLRLCTREPPVWRGWLGGGVRARACGGGTGHQRRSKEGERKGDGGRKRWRGVCCFVCVSHPCVKRGWGECGTRNEEGRERVKEMEREEGAGEVYGSIRVSNPCVCFGGRGGRRYRRLSGGGTPSPYSRLARPPPAASPPSPRPAP